MKRVSIIVLKIAQRRFAAIHGKVVFGVDFLNLVISYFHHCDRSSVIGIDMESANGSYEFVQFMYYLVSCSRLFSYLRLRDIEGSILVPSLL